MEKFTVNQKNNKKKMEITINLVIKLFLWFTLVLGKKINIYNPNFSQN